MLKNMYFIASIAEKELIFQNKTAAYEALMALLIYNSFKMRSIFYGCEVQGTGHED